MGRQTVILGGLVRGFALLLGAFLVLLLGGCDATAEEPAAAESDVEMTDALLSGGPWFCAYHIVSGQVSLEGDDKTDVDSPAQVPDDLGDESAGEVVVTPDESAAMMSVSFAIDFDEDEDGDITGTISSSRGSAEPSTFSYSVEIPEDSTSVALMNGDVAPCQIAWRMDGTYVVSLSSDLILGDLIDDPAVVAPEVGAQAILVHSSADAELAATSVDVSNGLVAEGVAPATESASYSVDGYELFSPEDDNHWYWRRVGDASGGEG